MADDPSFDDNLKSASSALADVHKRLGAAFEQAAKGSDKQRKERAYDIDLLSHEAGDIYDRLLSIMHRLDVSHP